MTQRVNQPDLIMESKFIVRIFKAFTSETIENMVNTYIEETSWKSVPNVSTITAYTEGFVIHVSGYVYID